jgi:hypothetical protein
MIYIQSNAERTLPHHFDVASAMFGVIENAQDYRLTSFEEVQSGKFDLLIKNNLFVGSVEFMKEVFSRIGKENTRVPKNSNREHIVMTLGEAKEISKSKSIFIKPFDIKLFTGFVLDQMIHTSISDIPDDIKVMVYDVFSSPIKSEWRCYVHRDEVVDIRNYSGDIFTYPSEYYLSDVLYKIDEGDFNFPIAYTIDIGILEDGRNVVIEYNDMWAIGNYGMPNDLYLRLLRDRYFEIVK